MTHAPRDGLGSDPFGRRFQLHDKGIGFCEELARKLDLAFCDTAGIERLKPRPRGEQKHKTASRQHARGTRHDKGNPDAECKHRDHNCPRCTPR
jgi:hypothetical protein